MIKIKNVYYMLVYAYDLLDFNGYKELGSEDFDNLSDLFALILCNSVNTLIKKGLNKTYVDTADIINTIRGKLNITECINQNTLINKKAVCTYDELTVNNELNKIIKTTIYYLLGSDASLLNKKKLRKLLLYFNDVDYINIDDIKWSFKFYRHIINYKMIITICYFVLNGLVQTTSDGKKKVAHFIDDDKMSKLYEKFLLKFYQRECPNLSTSSSKIKWQLDDGYDFRLPDMQSDVMITKDGKVLIIDAKYYSNVFNYHYNKESVHSNNLYQIFTYVKNKQEEEKDKEVSGMLLYAKTNNIDNVNENYSMYGNSISVRTLDLNQEFYMIKDDLFNIVNTYFNKGE